MKERMVLIFDLDGTLMDTMDGITHAADTVLSARGFSVLGRSFYERAIGGGARALIQKAVSDAGGGETNVDKILADFLETYKSDWSIGLRCYPGMEEVVGLFKENGYTIGVNTNKGHELAVLVVRSIFSESLITEVIGSSADYPKKPDPAGLDRLLSSLGRSRDEAIYIGDSKVDIETAKQAGIPVIAVTWGYENNALLEGADQIVETADDLYEKVKGMCKN